MTTIAHYPLREWLDEIVAEVFNTMLGLEAAPAPGVRMNPAGSRISGAIGVVGESVTGVVYLHVTLDFANQITALMLGCPEGTAPDDPEVNDVVAEFCNMIGGQFKSTLCNYGTPCAMSTPSIIRGSAFAIESNPKAWTGTFSFRCLGQTLAVEVHLESQAL